MLCFRKLLRRIRRHVRPAHNAGTEASARGGDVHFPATAFGQLISAASYRAALATLSPERRALFELHQIDGLPFAVIARRQDVSVEHVEREIAAALAHLATRLATDSDGPPTPPSD